MLKGLLTGHLRQGFGGYRLKWLFGSAGVRSGLSNNNHIS